MYNKKRKVLIIIQYFYPSPGITSKLYLDLARVLVENGFDVTVFTTNRCHVTENEISPLEEEKDGIHIRRFDIPQVKTRIVSRFIQSYFLQKQIRKYYCKEKKQFDFAIIGSHPVFSYILFPFLKKKNENIKIIHWCFDLFPDAIYTIGGMLGWLSYPMRIITKKTISKADVFVDLGICMRKRLQAYSNLVRNETLTPWALVEEDALRQFDRTEKNTILGNHQFFLIFSGSVTFGRDMNVFIDFIRYCRERGIDAALCIAGFGHFAEKLKRKYHDCSDYIVFLNYSDEKVLRNRLSAADVHLLSLEDKATGVAVPSKFFAALAVGRPVIAAVSPESCIAKWIEQYQIGAVLRENEYEKPFQFVKRMFDDQDFRQETCQKSLEAYKKEFSREVVTTRWVKLINETLNN